MELSEFIRLTAQVQERAKLIAVNTVCWSCSHKTDVLVENCYNIDEHSRTDYGRIYDYDIDND